MGLRIWEEAVASVTESLTVREAARRRHPLDGADAQALEAALADTERRLDALRRAVLEAAVLRATCVEGRQVHLREQEWDRIVALAGER